MNKIIIQKAVNLWREGKLVAFPTETVYGLGADAANSAAIQAIFTAKQRPTTHPLIVHVANLDVAAEWAYIDERTRKLANAFWPGPLTLILPKAAHVHSLITSGQETIGIRIPRHPIAQALLLAFGGGIAAPSANQFTHVSPTTATAVYAELGDQVDLIIDGGECEVGLESTIIDLSQQEPYILRPGMLSQAEIEERLGCGITVPGEFAKKNKAPGQHLIHYAPRTKTILIASDEIGLQLKKYIDEPVALITYSQMSIVDYSNLHHVCLSALAKNYAHDIYRVLRELDDKNFSRILIEAVPDDIEWAAIRDRLTKASHR